MATAELLQRGREAYDRHAWSGAHEALAAADREAEMEAGDLERLATAAYLLGLHDESEDAFVRAHEARLRRGQAVEAARCAVWLALTLINRDEYARGGGWMARAGRILDDVPRPCVEHGFLLLPVAVRHATAGELEAACADFEKAAAMGDDFDEPDLSAFARSGLGRVLIRMGKVQEGVALLDESMASLEVGEVSPLMAGEVYCSLIAGCWEIFDLRRAKEWTAALTRWWSSQPDVVPNTGECLVRRSEIVQLNGDWEEALELAHRACERVTHGPDPASAGLAYYQLAELCRLTGDYAAAEENYRQANRWGERPEPGLALLRLAQDRLEAARAMLQRALGEAPTQVERTRLLPACVDILLAASDVKGAEAAAGELRTAADSLRQPLLEATAAQAEGAVLLAAGHLQDALDCLRDAYSQWQKLDVPYEVARVRTLMGLACRRLGDEEGAHLELDAARWTFKRLGANPDAARVEALIQSDAPAAPGGLTERQIEVLRLVASGCTNQQIAEELVISPKTVARHLDNIYTKLDVNNRAEATAYAYRHGLV